MSKKIESLRASYLRCQEHGDLVEEFFSIFIASHPVIKLLFANSDINKQKQTLEQGIEYILSFNTEYNRAMKAINAFHKRLTPGGSSKIMSIYLKYWKESFIKAVSRIDPQFNKNLEESWNQVLQLVISYLGSEPEKQSSKHLQQTA